MTVRCSAAGWLAATRSHRRELLFQLLDAIEPTHGEHHHRIQRFGRARQTELERPLLAPDIERAIEIATHWTE